MEEVYHVITSEKEKPALDFNYLKEKAIDLLQRNTGKQWTDFNTHDPGITILEVLCYAITELSYRTEYDMVDILENPPHSKEKPKDSFFNPAQILSSGCVTFDDYRKLLLDLKSIKNLRIFEQKPKRDFKGVFDIELELFPAFNNAEFKQVIRERIKNILDDNRNLGETLGNIYFVEEELITFDIEIEVDKQINNVLFLNELIDIIENYLSPSIDFDDLESLLNQNISIEKIFDGPLLNNGFLLTEKLKEFQIRQTIYTSDLIFELMKIESVKIVRKIDITDSSGKRYNWSCRIPEGKVPHINLANSKLNIYFKNNLISSEKMQNSELVINANTQTDNFSHKNNKIPKPKGDYYPLEDYYSIQNDFPETYGIGKFGLPPNADAKRIAQTKQLKGYLLFFDQILANFFSQLSNVRHLFSIDNISQTYYSQPIFDAPGIEFLYKPFVLNYLEKYVQINDEKHFKHEWEKYKEKNRENFEAIIQKTIERPEVFTERRNRALDHLLSRFAFDTANYELLSNRSPKEMIEYKLNLLNNLEPITKNRSYAEKDICAFYSRPQEKYYGFRKRMATLFGFNNQQNRRLTDAFSADYLMYETEKNAQDYRLSKPSFPETTLLNDVPYTGDIYGLDDEKLNEIKEINLQFSNCSQSELIEQLFKYGLKNNNYEISHEFTNIGQYYINLYDDTHQHIAKSDEFLDSNDKAEKAIQKLISQLRKAEDFSLGFYLLEHNYLRPTSEMNVFKFQIVNHNEEVIFSDISVNNFERREEKVEEAIKQGKNPKNFQIVEIGNGEFKINLLASSGLRLLEGNVIFPNQTKALQETDFYASIFEKMSSEKLFKEKSIRYFTSFSEVFNEIDDPFSFHVSVVLPTWPAKFQDQRFRKFIEDSFSREIPAHIVLHISWLSFENLRELENKLIAFYNEKRNENPDSKKIESLTVEIFSLLY